MNKKNIQNLLNCNFDNCFCIEIVNYDVQFKCQNASNNLFTLDKKLVNNIDFLKKIGQAYDVFDLKQKIEIIREKSISKNYHFQNVVI